MEAIFSATPPLESLRMLMAIASQPIDNPEDPLCIMLLDVSRAHFYARAEREVYIQLPPEDPRSGEKDICGKLLKTMYGTLDAAERWGGNTTPRCCVDLVLSGARLPPVTLCIPNGIYI